MKEECPNFVAAVMALGKTRRRRAEMLQTSPKTVDRLMERLPKPLEIFQHQPHLLRILADDLERRNTTPN